MDRSDPSVGAVVIGRNEGERLVACLESLSPQVQTVVYVDSGSTDGSVEAAHRLSVEVVCLPTSSAFTAARARNAGFQRLLEIDPSCELVQFVDGDCEVDAGWIGAAVNWIHGHEQVAVVCGRRRETDRRQNVFHRLVDMEWDTPVGESLYCGGDTLVRAKALATVGGYRESLIAGEEPELCLRLRSAGWKVWRLDREMTRHDIRMSTFAQWWKRTVRSGHAYAEGAALHGRSPARHWVREQRSNWVWGVIVPVGLLLLAWPTHGWSLLGAAIYLLQSLRVARSRHAQRGESWSDCCLYGVFTMIGKFACAQGQATFWINRLRKRQTRLMEYHSSGATFTSDQSRTCDSTGR